MKAEEYKEIKNKLMRMQLIIDDLRTEMYDLKACAKELCEEDPDDEPIRSQ